MVRILHDRELILVSGGQKKDTGPEKPKEGVEDVITVTGSSGVYGSAWAALGLGLRVTTGSGMGAGSACIGLGGGYGVGYSSSQEKMTENESEAQICTLVCWDARLNTQTGDWLSV